MGTTTTLVTVQEFLQWPESEGQHIELIQGEVISRGSGHIPHEVVKKNLDKILALWLAQNPPAELFAETMYHVDEHNARMPDLSVLFPGRIAPRGTGWIPGAPEIAVEVVSSETAARLEDKIELYLSHGGKSVRVVYPRQRAVRIHDAAAGGARRFERDQTLSDPAVLPGFAVPTSAIFEGV
jgi:Uma2 family endonuclease